MSAKLTLAGPEAMARLLPMVAACHDGAGIATDEAHREAALAPLLEGSPLGAVYLVGPPRTPIGYIALTFGWSIERGGMDGFVGEFWLREAVRGRGVGGEVLAALIPALAGAGLKALHLEAGAADDRAEALYLRHGFARSERYRVLTRLL